MIRLSRQACVNKKQCSRQLQCEVPCSIGNVMNSSLFINSSLSSLSSTSHAIHREGGVPAGEGGLAGGRGQGTFQSSCHILHYHMVLRPEGTSHNYQYSTVFSGILDSLQPATSGFDTPGSRRPTTTALVSFIFKTSSRKTCHTSRGSSLFRESHTRPFAVQSENNSCRYNVVARFSR